MKTPYLCVLLLALVACKSTEAPPPEPLPFHVAIKFNGVVSEGGSAGENASPEEEDLEIVLDREEVVRELEFWAAARDYEFSFDDIAHDLELLDVSRPTLARYVKDNWKTLRVKVRPILTRIYRQKRLKWARGIKKKKEAFKYTLHLDEKWFHTKKKFKKRKVPPNMADKKNGPQGERGRYP